MVQFARVKIFVKWSEKIIGLCSKRSADILQAKESKKENVNLLIMDLWLQLTIFLFEPQVFGIDQFACDWKSLFILSYNVIASCTR